ncbi:acetate--CoA ligase family protein [Rhizorhapis suberifaciens]|uniref:Acyl-CoA synthetase (NDP forming) n=1 Tax=Rhizorhapis suberifaciens TaxID=13656 RepID=A0A840HU17_9SPHN|nr:acetate--CoA ligase family protein [Rhizorhapis suberifaciens]MBB4640996.1 acyl-CoA synthetase (NDP forming) [Rhizorhapis suberifaciens]
MTVQTAPIPSTAIDRLLAPKSVVIVGASDKPGALGASVLGNLERLGYQGDIHLINPKRDEINGRPCLQSIDDLPEGVDAAILAIPRAGVVEAVKALAGRKVGAAVIFSAGFAEGGEEGLAEQREIARIAQESGMVIEGPNCLGMINYVDGVPLTFVEMPTARLEGRKGIGVVSQSGAMAAVLSVSLLSRDLGISYFVSTGNEAASGVEDYVDYLIDDPHTQVIAMIVEQFRKPQRFLSAARRAREAGKPIVLLHPGKSSAARESAATHTGAMAGDYKVMRTKVERAGVLVVENLEELGDVADIAARCVTMPTGGTAVLGESGAFKALTLDLAEDIGLLLPELHDDSSPALRAAMPDFIPVSNPLDLTAQALVDPGLYERTLSALLPDERFGCVVLAIIQTDPATASRKFPPVIEAIKKLNPSKPVIFTGVDEGAEVPAEYISGLRALGVSYFPSPDRALRAIAHLSQFAARDLYASGATPLKAEGLPLHGVVPEYRAKQILAPLGVPFPNGRFATSLDEAKTAAADIGYPVVIKAQSAELSHKSDAGGVILNISDVEALAAAWAQLFVNVGVYNPSLKLDGVLIEGMGKRGTELIIGARNDPEWGPVILAGFGGVQAEILQDVRLLATDLGRKEIIAELSLLKSSPLLRGFRGSPALDVGAVADIILRLGQLLLGEPSIREVDLNPVIVYPEGEGAVALDALMLVG